MLRNFQYETTFNYYIQRYRLSFISNLINHVRSINSKSWSIDDKETFHMYSNDRTFVFVDLKLTVYDVH